jgi:hypothetical protein
MVPGARVLLQVHYHSAHEGHHALPDQTRVLLKLADNAKPSAWLTVLDTRWLLSDDRFRIPVGAKNVVYRFSGNPHDLAPFGTGDVDLSKGFRVYGAALHMHYLGTGGKLAVNRPNGRSDVLLSVRNWDFRWQGGFFFREPETFEPNDALELECRWDNTAANQPVIDGVKRKPRLVTWGEGSLDEMCVGYLFISAR